jgi:hypothetical protein
MANRMDSVPHDLLAMLATGTSDDLLDLDWLGAELDANLIAAGGGRGVYMSPGKLCRITSSPALCVKVRGGHGVHYALHAVSLHWVATCLRPNLNAFNVMR